MMTDEWFSRTLCLPEGAMFPAVAVKLARGDADDAITLWEAWRGYVYDTPGVLTDTRANAFAGMLRRSVENLACTAYPDVVWAAVWHGAVDAVPDLAWDLLVSEMPLTVSAIRARAVQPGMPLIVDRAQGNGERLSREARGPFLLGTE